MTFVNEVNVIIFLISQGTPLLDKYSSNFYNVHEVRGIRWNHMWKKK